MKDKTYPWVVLAITSLGIFLQNLNISSLNVAIPEISAYYNAGAVATSWILLSYMLFSTILLLSFGKLADIYGRRRLFLLGMIEFTVVSFLCGFAPNVGTLIFLRCLQAVGGALIASNTVPLVTDAFAENNLGVGLGFNALIASLSALMGPVVGGYLIFVLSWQWVFWFNVPLGIIGIIWGFFSLHRGRGVAHNEKIDMLGNITVFLGLGGLILAFSESGVTGWRSLPVIVGLVLFFSSTLCFIWAERRAADPILDFALISNRSFSMAVLATFLNALARASVVLLISLFFQVAGHEDPFSAGIKILPVTLGMFFAAPLAATLSTRCDLRRLSASGLFISCIGTFMLMWFIGGSNTQTWIIAGQFLIGFGSGIFQTPNTQTIMTAADPMRRGVANGLRHMLINMGHVVSTAFSLMIVTSALPARLKDAFYSGTHANIAAEDIFHVIAGYRLVFLIMLLLTVFAIAATLVRAKAGRAVEEDAQEMQV